MVSLVKTRLDDLLEKVNGVKREVELEALTTLAEKKSLKREFGPLYEDSRKMPACRYGQRRVIDGEPCED